MTTYPLLGDESIMSDKKHGTSDVPVQDDLRWGCDKETADRICNFNRHYAGKTKKKKNMVILLFGLLFS
jgi:hypothetical protein